MKALSHINRTLPQSQPTSAWLRKLFSFACLATSDLLTVLAALAAVVFLRNFVLPHIFPQLGPDSFPFAHYLNLWWLFPLWLGFFAYEGLYTHRMAFWDEFRSLWKAITLAGFSAFAIVALGKLSEEISRLVLFLHWGTLLLLLPLARWGTKRLLFQLGLWKKPVIILGAAQTGALTLQALNQEPSLGYEVVGFLDDDLQKQGQTVGEYHGQAVRVLGPLNLAQQLLEQNIARDVIIAITSLSPAKLAEVVNSLQGKAETIRIVPNFFGLPTLEAQVDHMLGGQALLLSIPNNLAKPWNIWLKRGFDLIVSGVITIATLPLMSLLVLLIRLDSPGSAFYTHERLGRNGRVFRCHKFRSMYVDADEKLTDHLEANPQLRAEWETYKKLKSCDPRVTRVGKFMRRWSLDELPQLFNVLKGEMSLVGPRPYLLRERESMEAHTETILSAWPGMTGLWQVSGKNELSFERRLYLESWYVRNWSLWLDLMVLLKTCKTVLRREGAY